MASDGITGVLNVQTEIDMAHRGVDWPRMLKHYQKFNIFAQHFPIHDFNETDLKLKLYEAACVLNDMINNRGLSVYVHCTAGMGRAPAVVLTYMCLFLNYEPEEADIYVKTWRKVSVPNMRAVKEVVYRQRESNS